MEEDDNKWVLEIYEMYDNLKGKPVLRPLQLRHQFFFSCNNILLYSSIGLNCTLMLGLIIYRLLWDKIKENIFYSPDPCPHLQNVGSVENGAQVAVKVMKKNYPIIMESNFDIALKLLEDI
jgi:hypothetical protein